MGKYKRVYGGGENEEGEWGTGLPENALKRGGVIGLGIMGGNRKHWELAQSNNQQC